jgi:hypothetical protein
MRMSIVRLVAASLVSALVAGPVLLDACMFSCHGSNNAETAQSPEGGEPSCHHVTAEADLRLEPPPTSCGHDHSPTLSTMTQQREAAARCDLGFGVCDSPDVQDSMKRESRIANPIVPDTRSCCRAFPPLRV